MSDRPAAQGTACTPSLAPAAEVLCVDSFAESGLTGTPAWTTRVLARGLTYAIDVDGTYSVWAPGQWGGVQCGIPRPAPHYPTPAKTNGPVGIDAETLFATPFDCAVLDPRRSFNLRFQLSPGTRAFHPNPVAADPAAHRYTYEVVGRGFRAGAAIFDRPVSDNYGQLRLRVRLASACGAIDELRRVVESLGLRRGVETSLTSKLSAAARACARGSVPAAAAMVQAFANEVQALRGKAIEEADAEFALLAGASDIVAALGELR